MRLRIVSDGTAPGTKFLNACGDEIQLGTATLTKVEIAPIVPGGTVSVILHLSGVGLDLDVLDAIGINNRVAS